MKVISYVIIVTLIASVLVNAQAFATPQPYVAGYPNTTTITKHGQYTAITDFIGTPTATRENDISSVFSSATYASSTAATPTGWIHQQAVTLKPTNSIYGAHQIYKGPTCMSNCSGVNYVILGTHGTGLGDIKNVYTTFFFNGPTITKVSFYYEPKTNAGNIIAIPLQDYLMSSTQDPSTKYAIGTFYQNINVGGVLQNTKFKLYQFGVEGGPETGPLAGEVSQSWVLKQRNLTYQGAAALSGIPAVSLIGTSTDNNNGGNITPYTKSDGTIGRVAVGGRDYSSAGASYNLNDATVLKGTVIWKKSSTHISGGTALWN